MTDTVTVACKVPNGLLLRIHDMVDSIEPSPAGGRKVKVAQQLGQTVRINGTSSSYTLLPEMAMIHGFALTRGVDKDFWERWLEENPDSELVRNRLIFASPNDRDIMDEAQECRSDGVKSGLEPLDPKNLPKGMSLRGLKIETAEEQQIKPRALPEPPLPTPPPARARVRRK